MRSFFRGLLVMLIGFMVSQNLYAQEDVLSVNNVWGAAADKKFGWSLGNIAGYYDPISNRGDATVSLIKLNWHLPYNVGLGVTLIESQGHDADNGGTFKYYTFLPVDFSYNLFSIKDMFYGGFYLDGSFQFYTNDGKATFPPFGNKYRGLFGGIGFRFFFFHTNWLRYSYYTSVFIEYNTNNELKIGASVDFGWLLWLILLGTSDAGKEMRPAAPFLGVALP
jgi:hypothetical protein